MNRDQYLSPTCLVTCSSSSVALAEALMVSHGGRADELKTGWVLIKSAEPVKFHAVRNAHHKKMVMWTAGADASPVRDDASRPGTVAGRANIRGPDQA